MAPISLAACAAARYRCQLPTGLTVGAAASVVVLVAVDCVPVRLGVDVAAASGVAVTGLPLASNCCIVVTMLLTVDVTAEATAGEVVAGAVRLPAVLVVLAGVLV